MRWLNDHWEFMLIGCKSFQFNQFSMSAFLYFLCCREAVTLEVLWSLLWMWHVLIRFLITFEVALITVVMQFWLSGYRCFTRRVNMELQPLGWRFSTWHSGTTESNSLQTSMIKKKQALSLFLKPKSMGSGINRKTGACPQGRPEIWLATSSATRLYWSMISDLPSERWDLVLNQPFNEYFWMCIVVICMLLSATFNSTFCRLQFLFEDLKNKKWWHYIIFVYRTLCWNHWHK